MTEKPRDENEATSELEDLTPERDPKGGDTSTTRDDADKPARPVGGGPHVKVFNG